MFVENNFHNLFRRLLKESDLSVNVYKDVGNVKYPIFSHRFVYSIDWLRTGRGLHFPGARTQE